MTGVFVILLSGNSGNTGLRVKGSWLKYWGGAAILWFKGFRRPLEAPKVPGKTKYVELLRTAGNLEIDNETVVCMYGLVVEA